MKYRALTLKIALIFLIMLVFTNVSFSTYIEIYSNSTDANYTISGVDAGGNMNAREKFVEIIGEGQYRSSNSCGDGSAYAEIKPYARYLNVDVVWIVVDLSFFECIYNSFLENYSCIPQGTYEEECWYNITKESFVCNNIDITRFGPGNYYSEPLYFTYTINQTPYENQDRLLEWSLAYYASFGDLQDGDACDSATNETWLFAPKLVLDNKDTIEKSINWSLGERIYPFAYVGDTLYLYPLIKNLELPNNHGRVFGVWRNFTVHNTTVIREVNASKIQIGDMNRGTTIPNTTTPQNHKIYFVIEALQKGKSRIDMNISDYSTNYSDSTAYELFVLSPFVRIKTDKKIYEYNQTANIYVYVHDNATHIENITLNISREEIINGKVINKSYVFFIEDAQYLGTTNDFLSQSFYSTYKFTFTPLNSSGRYYVHVNTSLKNYDQKIATNTLFYVKEGSLKLISSQPKYRVLSNQTGLFNITFIVVNGDLHNLSIIVNFTNTSKIKINSNNTIEVGNITSNKTLTISINITTNITGLVSYIVNYTYTYNDTFKRQELQPQPLQVIEPRIMVGKEVANITQDNYVEIRVVGNLSPISQTSISILRSITSTTFMPSLRDIISTTEDICYADEVQSGEKAYPIALREVNVDYANYTIDNITTTYATFKTFLGGSANITYNFSKEYVFREISIYGVAGATGEKAKIHYFDGEQYILIPETQYGVELPTQLNYTNITLLNPIKTNSIKIEIIGNNVDYIHEVKFLLPTITSEYLCMIYNYTLLAKEEINESGTYTIYASVIAKNNIASKGKFFINFGKPKINLCPLNDLGNIYLSNEVKDLEYIFVYPENGDLYNISLSLSIENETLINLSTGENATKHIEYISYYNTLGVSTTSCGNAGKMVTFNLTASSITNRTSTSINVTLQDYTSNITTYNDTGTIYLIPSDIESPVLWWWDYGYMNTTYQYILYNASNINYELKIIFNASDDVAIQSANAEITYPNGSQASYTGSVRRVLGTITNGTFIFTIPETLIKDTGNYTINLSVIDYAGNQSNYTDKNISIVNTIKVLIKREHSIYNRGQNYSVYFQLANKMISYDKTNTTFLINNSGNTTFVVCYESNSSCNASWVLYSGEGITYKILLNEIPSTYTTFIQIEYKNNTGNKEHRYSTTDKLNTSMQTFLNSEATQIALVRIYMKHQNDIDEISSLEYDYFVCNNDNYSLSYNPLGKYFEPVGFVGCSLPATMIVHGKFNNNTGYLMQTQSLSSPSQPSQAGGGGGEGSSGGGGGGFFSYNFSNNVSFIPDAKLTSYVNVNRISAIQEQKTSVRLSLINTGNVDLNLLLKVHTTCEKCEVKPNKTKILVKKQESTEKNINISIPFNQNPGKYMLIIEIKDPTYEIKRKHIIDLIIEENDEINRFKIQSDLLQRLSLQVEKYKSLGINTTYEEELVKANRELMLLLLSYYEKGDYSSFVKTLNKVMENNKIIEKSLKEKQWIAFLKENMQELIAVTLVAILVASFLYLYLIPLIYMAVKLKYLERKIKLVIASRIETEKQYFNRKIDEITFRRLMEKYQDELIKSRKEIERLSEDLRHLIKLNIFLLLKRHKPSQTRVSYENSTSQFYKRKESVFTRTMRLIKKLWNKKMSDSEKDLIRMLVTEPKQEIQTPKKQEEIKRTKKVVYFSSNEVDST